MRTVEDADAGADVAERERHVEAAVLDLDACSASGNVHQDAVREVGVERRVLLGRLDHERPQRREERELGHAGGPVARAHGGVGRSGQDERAARRRQRGDGDPVRHREDATSPSTARHAI